MEDGADTFEIDTASSDENSENGIETVINYIDVIDAGRATGDEKLLIGVGYDSDANLAYFESRFTRSYENYFLSPGGTVVFRNIRGLSPTEQRRILSWDYEYTLEDREDVRNFCEKFGATRLIHPPGIYPPQQPEV